MSAAVLNAQRGASNAVLLTQLGGDAFGNHDGWIHAAKRRAIHIMSGFALDVRIVSYGTTSRAMLQMGRGFCLKSDSKCEQRTIIATEIATERDGTGRDENE